MPRRDGSDPMGAGTMTGRGLGLCTGVNDINYGTRLGLGFACRCGYGQGLGRGFGRGFVFNQTSTKAQNDLLQEQKTILQNRLEEIDKRLANL